jgi:hypothetical protein
VSFNSPSAYGAPVGEFAQLCTPDKSSIVQHIRYPHARHWNVCAAIDDDGCTTSNTGELLSAQCCVTLSVDTDAVSTEPNEPATTSAEFSGACAARAPPKMRVKKSTDNFVKLNYKNKSYSRAPKKMTGSQFKRFQFRMRLKKNK